MNRLLTVIIAISLILSAEAYASQVTLSSYYPSPNSHMNVVTASTANFDNININNGMHIQQGNDVTIANYCADPSKSGNVYLSSLGLVSCQNNQAELVDDWSYNPNLHYLTPKMFSYDSSLIVKIPALMISDDSASPAYPVHLAIKGPLISYSNSGAEDGTFDNTSADYIDAFIPTTSPKFYVDPTQRIMFLGGKDTSAEQALNQLMGTDIIDLAGGANSVNSHHDIILMNAKRTDIDGNNILVLGTPNSDVSAQTMITADNAAFVNYTTTTFGAPWATKGFSPTFDAAVDIYTNGSMAALRVRGKTLMDENVDITGSVGATGMMEADGDIKTNTGNFRKGIDQYAVTSNNAAEFYYATFDGATNTRTSGSNYISIMKPSVGNYIINYSPAGAGVHACSSVGGTVTPTSQVSLTISGRGPSAISLASRTFAGVAIDTAFDVIFVCYK